MTPLYYYYGIPQPVKCQREKRKPMTLTKTLRQTRNARQPNHHLLRPTLANTVHWSIELAGDAKNAKYYYYYYYYYIDSIAFNKYEREFS
jgi:hypothetical protein